MYIYKIYIYIYIYVYIEKIKSIGIVPENAILVTADVAGLYPNITHRAGLKALKEALEKRDIKKIPTKDLMKNFY